MPRDGLQQYSPPPGTEGIPNYTVESARYNAFVADVTQDLNLPRPIVAGGTGASTPDGALDNLSAEKFKQVVTSWDSTVWRAGSFYAATTASGTAPVAGHAFAGIAYYANATDFVLKATDLTDPAAPVDYTRVMAAGVWSAWVQVAGNNVRFDAPQVLTEAQKVQARQNIYAAPFDAMSYNGMQINGSMEVSQEIGATPVPISGTTGKYIVDGWLASTALPTGVIVAGQVTLTTEIPGVQKCLQFTVSVAQATLGSSDFVRLITNIEGYRFSRAGWGTAGARPITVGFWARASIGGTYRVLCGNHDLSVTEWMPFTLTGGAAFQWVTVTFTARTTGVWKTDNGIGALLIFEMTSTSTPNVLASTSGYASITGVIILPGIEAPSAARSPLIMRPYDQELLTCQRYYAKVPVNFRFNAVGAELWGYSFKFPNTMRSAPALALAAGFTAVNTGTIAPSPLDPLNTSVNLTGSTPAAGDTYLYQSIILADARL
jgi:hypothetical protein